MTRTLPLPTRTEAPHVTDLDARLRLDTAVRLLTQPTVEKLDRIDRALDSIAAAQTREDRDIERGLAATHARLLAAGHAAQAATVLSRLTAHRRVVAARTARQDTREAEVPPLLDLILDAVHSTGGSNGAGGAGAHAAPIGLSAAELVHTIQRTTTTTSSRTPSPAAHCGNLPDARPCGEFTGEAADQWCLRCAWAQWAHPPPGLITQVRRWAAARGATAGVDDITPAAQHAEQWVAQARAILTPPKRWTHPGACPACGKTTAYVADESGQQVRRPALELNRADASARCLRCDARWQGEGQLRSLARVLEDQAP